MRGQILGVDRSSGEGQIAGDDGRRYRFRQDDWSDAVGPAVGAMVDFDANESRAISIYRVPGLTPATIASPATRPTRPVARRSKIGAAVLAFFFGVMGIHRFYLGRTGSGIAMLLLTCTVVGIVASLIWSWVDIFRLLFMTNADFANRYDVEPV
ncbi:TM2 domain-containing protein [Sphingomonas sp. RS2018]